MILGPPGYAPRAGKPTRFAPVSGLVSAVQAVECRHCEASNPEAARFCQRCGQHLGDGKGGRHDHFAAHPDEPVHAVAFVSTLLPHATGARLHQYRIVIYLALAVPAIAAGLGFLPFAVASAVVALPAVYVVYLHDAGVWEDSPGVVLALALLLPAALAAVITIVWREVLFVDDFRVPLNLVASTLRLREVVVLCAVTPVIAALVSQLGPVLLALRPRYGELLDGLTFGVLSGMAYAGVETVVLHRDLIVGAHLHTSNVDAARWVLVILVVGLLKPIVYGAAAGIAAAEFSGPGGGRHFSPRYAFALVEAVAVLVVFQSVLYGTSLVRGTSGALLGALATAAVASLLIVQLRVITHKGILEAEIESEATDVPSHCGHCRVALLEGARFCVSCGRSVQAQPKRQPASPPAGAVTPSGLALGAGDAHRVVRPIALGVVVVLAVLVAGGAGAGVAGATTASGVAVGRLVDLVPDASGATIAGTPIALAHGVTVTHVAGWRVGDRSASFAALTGRGGAFTVQVSRVGADVTAPGLVGAFVQSVLDRIVTDLAPSQPVVEASPAPAVASASTIGFRGTLASAQLSSSIEGFVYAMVLRSGVAVVIVTFNRRGRTRPLGPDYARLLDPVIRSGTRLAA